MKKICFILVLMSCVITAAFPAQVTIPKTWIASETIKAQDLNNNFRAIASGVNRIDVSNLSPLFVLPTAKLENGSLIASHSLRHRHGGADPLTGSYTIYLLSGSGADTPTTASGVANKAYVDSTIPNMASITAHLITTTNPHGQVLTQGYIASASIIETAQIGLIDVYTGVPYGAGLLFTATSAQLIPAGAVAFTTDLFDFGASATGDFVFANNAASPPQYIVFNPFQKILDWASTTLTNFQINASQSLYLASQTWPDVQPYVASYVLPLIPATYTNVAMYYVASATGLASGPTTYTGLTVPSSFTAGFYEVNFAVQPRMVKTNPNAVDVTYALLVGGATKFSFDVSIPAASNFLGAFVSQTEILYLSPGDVLTFTIADVNGTGTGTNRYRLSVRFLATTRTAL